MELFSIPVCFMFTPDKCCILNVGKGFLAFEDDGMIQGIVESYNVLATDGDVCRDRA